MLYLDIVLSHRCFIKPRKDKLEGTDSIASSRLIDVVHMKDVIVLNEEIEEEVGSLRALLEKPTAFIWKTALIIGVNHVPRFFVANMVIPLLVVYAYLTVTDANGLFQATFAILCTFQFSVAFNIFSLLEAQFDEYLIAERRLRSVIDTSGLAFVFYPKDDSEEDPSQDDSKELSASNTDFKSSVVLLQNIVVEYSHPSGAPGVRVLKGLSMRINSQERVALVGESVSPLNYYQIKQVWNAEQSALRICL